MAIAIKNINKKNIRLVVAMWILVVISIVLFLTHGFFSVSYSQDEGYQALNCMYYGESPLGMLTFYTGNVAIRLFGDGVIVLRLLCELCILLAVTFPLIYFYRRTQNTLWTLCMAFYLVNFIRCNWMYHLLYSWDTATYPYESLLLVCLMTYLDRPARLKAALAGALCATLILARITACMAFPVMILAILFAYPRSRRSRSLKDVGISILSFASVAILLIIIMKGSVRAYIESWAPENIITGHDMGAENMKRVLGWCIMDLRELKVIASYGLQILVMVGLTEVSRQFWPRYGWKIIAALVTVYLIIMRFQWHGAVPVGVYIVPLTQLAIIGVISYYAKGLAKGDSLKLLLIMAFVLVPVVGSDRIMRRFGFFYCIPLLMYIIYRYKSLILNRIVMALMAYTIVPVFVYGVYERIENFTGTNFVHEDIPHHQFIYDYPQKWAELHDTGKVAELLRRDGIKFAFFGSDHYVMEYIYNLQSPAHIQWFHYYEPAQIAEWIKVYTQEQDAVFFRNVDTQFFSHSEGDRIFRANGFVPVKKMTDYTLYMAPDNPYLKKINNTEVISVKRCLD